MEFSYYSKPLSISLLDEILRRALVYVPLLVNLYYLRQNYLPTFMDSSSTGTISWIFQVRNLAEPLSIIAFILTLITFQRHYVFRKAYVNKQAGTLKIQFHGRISAVLNFLLGLVRVGIYFFAFDIKLKSSMQSKYLIMGLILCGSSLVSIIYSQFYILKLSNTRMVFYLKLSKTWRYIHSFAIIGIFLYVCFFHPNYLVQIIFRTTFLISSFLLVYKLQRKTDTFVKLEFVNTFVNSKVLFLAISSFTYFEGFRVLDYNLHQRSIEASFADERTRDYFEALTLFLICCRHRLYFEINTLVPHMLYGVSLDHPLLRAAFPPRSQLLVRDRSQFYSYFMEKILSITGMTNKDIINTGGDLKDGFLKDMLEDNREVRERFSEHMRTKFGLEEKAQKWKTLAIGSQIKLFFLGFIASLARNIEPIFKVLVQISCMFYVYSITNDRNTTYLDQVLNTGFGFILTYWSLFSYKLNAADSMLKFTTLIIIPTLIAIQCNNMMKYYRAKFILQTDLPPITTTTGWLLKQNETAMSVLVFLYAMVSSVTAHRLQVKNNFVVEISTFSSRFSTLWKSNPFDSMVTGLYEFFFNQFPYLITSLTIATTMLDVNFVNLIFMSFSIAFLTLRSKNNQTWIYYAFTLDFLILVKVVLSTMPKYGILNNIELMAIIGVFTLPQENNSTYILFLMIATMLTCYYIYYVDSFLKTQYKKKKAQAQKSSSKVTQGKISLLVSAFLSHSQKYILLAYHGVLIFLLILDGKKDFFTLYLFALEAAIIPIHLYIYLSASSPPHGKLYKFFIPVFASALTFVIFRYILFFQKFAFFNHLYQGIRSKYGFFAEFNMKRDTGWNQRTLQGTFANFDIEFCVLVATIFAMVRFKGSETEEAIKKGVEEQEDKVESLTEENRRDSALIFVAWNLSSQFILSFLISKSMTNRPNLLKTGIMAIWLLYLVGLFRSLSSGLQSLRLTDITDHLFEYFRQTFITRLKPYPKPDVKYSEDTETKERTQIKAYYGIVLKEFENILRVRNRMISFFLTVGCLWLNLYTLGTHILSRYYGPQNVTGMVWLLGFDPLNSSMVVNDLIYTHILILWFLVDLGIYIIYYSRESALLPTFPDTLKQICVDCLLARFDLYLFERTKNNGHQFILKRNHYFNILKKFDSELESAKAKDKLLSSVTKIDTEETDHLKISTLVPSPDNAAVSCTLGMSDINEKAAKNLAVPDNMLSAADPQFSQLKPREKETEKLTEMPSNLLTESFMFDPSSNPAPPKTQESGDIIYLSELTSTEDKILYVYINRNKYFYGRMIRSFFFNVPRLSLCFMVLNLIYSQTIPDYGLLVICFIFSLRTCRVFFDSNYLLPVGFGLYFLTNWMFIRYDRLDWGPYRSIVNFLAPQGPAKVSSFVLLLGVGVYNLGFAVTIYYIHYACNSLLTVKKPSIPIHMTTRDEYLFIDYKLWKKGALNKMNFIFKVAHTLLIEVFALTTFVTCFFIQGHAYFKTPVLISVFLLIISEGLQSLKILAKTLEETQKHSGAKGFIGLTTKVMKLICWTAIIVESWDVFRAANLVSSPNLDLSPGVILVFYLTVSVSDLIFSEEYESNRGQVRQEESLKTSLTALNTTYKMNEEKIFSRLNAFMGKDELEEMAKQCVFAKDFDQVKLHMNYNQETLTTKLDELYLNLQNGCFNGIQFVRQRILHSLYTFLNENVNHFRYQDIFVLYRNIIRRNSEVLTVVPVELGSYFSHDYHQFETVLKDSRIFYDLFKERRADKLAFFAEKLEEFEKMAQTEKFFQEREGKTYKELSIYEWVRHEHAEGQPALQAKPKTALKAAAALLVRELERHVGVEGGNQTFDTLKVEMNKKGYVHCSFGKLKIIVYNLRTDVLGETQGFLLFRTNALLYLIATCLMSNVELCVSVTMAIIAAFNGGAMNLIILGVILFAVLIEETYGNLTWWKVAYVMYLIKLFLHIIDSQQPFIAWLLGSYLWTDILQTILINLVVFQQRKIGFAEEFMFNIEDPGTCVVRLIANKDFDQFVDRICQVSKMKLETLVGYLENKFKENVSQEVYRSLKTKCTFTIANLYLAIDEYRVFGRIAALKFFRRLKEDTFTNSTENGNSFFWRNFSSFSRKPGSDLTAVVYLLLTGIVALVILFLQSEESGKNVVSSLFTGTQAISSQTVITILIYVTLLFLEKYFDSMPTNDTIGTRYNEIYVDFCKLFAEEKAASFQKHKDKLSPLMKFRRAIRKILIVLKMKATRRSNDNFKSNPYYYKYFLMIFFWVIVNGMVFVVQPIMAYANRNGLFEKDLSAFMCVDAQPTCYSYNKMSVAKVFYLLNILYIFITVQQMRKGRLMAMPREVTYANIMDEIKYYLYYKPPILREICTLVEYSSQNTTLDIDDWLLCEDLKEYMINAKISHSTNEVKNAGQLVEPAERVSITLVILIIIIGIMIVPLFLFSKFTSGDQEQQITQASIKLTLFAGDDRFVTNLYKSGMMLENRELNQAERDTLASLPTTRLLDRNHMNVISFSAFSDNYLDTEESSKQYIISHIMNSTAPFILLSYDFTTEDKVNYRKDFRIPLVDSLKENIVSVVFAQCATTENSKSSELFIMMLPQILEFSNKVVEEKKVDPTFTQKLGLSLRCDNGERKSYIWIMSVGRPTFYVILVPKNDAYEFIAKYFKLDNLTLIGMYSLIFGWLAIRIIRPAIFGQSVNLGFTEMPRNQIIVMILDAMHFARLDRDLLLEELLFDRLQDIMRDYDQVFRVTDSTMLYREKNLYERYKHLQAK